METKTMVVKHTSKKRILKIILSIFLAFFVLYTILDIFFDGLSVGHFSSIEGKQEYYNAYDEAMASMPSPTNTYDIETSWGIVRVYEWKNDKNESETPILLLPGHSSGTPMWKINLPGFSKEHTVYSIDVLGDTGKSTQLVPFKTIDDVTGWLNEVIENMNIGDVHLVGHSFGGGYVADYAAAYPKHVQSLTLLEPAFALNSPSASVLFWATVSSMEFLPKAWRDKGLAKMTGEDLSEVTAASEDPLTRMISAAAVYYSASLPTPATLKAEQINKLDMPVYVALGDHSPITGEKAKKNAALIPDGTVKVWENTTHSLPMEVPDELASELNEFWRKSQST